MAATANDTCRRDRDQRIIVGPKIFEVFLDFQSATVRQSPRMAKVAVMVSVVVMTLGLLAAVSGRAWDDPCNVQPAG